MPEWIEAATNGGCNLQAIYDENDNSERKLLAKGDEFEGLVSAEFDGEVQEWTARALVVRTESYRRVQRQSLVSRPARNVRLARFCKRCSRRTIEAGAGGPDLPG